MTLLGGGSDEPSGQQEGRRRRPVCGEHPAAMSVDGAGQCHPVRGTLAWRNQCRLGARALTGHGPPPPSVPDSRADHPPALWLPATPTPSGQTGLVVPLQLEHRGFWERSLKPQAPGPVVPSGDGAGTGLHPQHTPLPWEPMRPGPWAGSARALSSLSTQRCQKEESAGGPGPCPGGGASCLQTDTPRVPQGQAGWV